MFRFDRVTVEDDAGACLHALSLEIHAGAIHAIFPGSARERAALLRLVLGYGGVRVTDGALSLWGVASWGQRYGAFARREIGLVRVEEDGSIVTPDAAALWVVDGDALTLSEARRVGEVLLRHIRQRPDEHAGLLITTTGLVATTTAVYRGHLLREGRLARSGDPIALVDTLMLVGSASARACEDEALINAFELPMRAQLGDEATLDIGVG